MREETGLLGEERGLKEASGKRDNTNMSKERKSKL